MLDGKQQHRVPYLSRAGVIVALLFIAIEFFYIYACQGWDCLLGIFFTLPSSALVEHVLLYLSLSYQLEFVDFTPPHFLHVVYSIGAIINAIILYGVISG